MALFEEVKAEEFPNFREGHRGRVSFPIIKAFLESGYHIGKLDRTQLGKTSGHLKGLLGWYCKKHDKPIKLITRQGELYFLRLDFNEDGSANPNWREDQLPPEEQETPEGAAPLLEAADLNALEIEKHAGKGKKS